MSTVAAAAPIEHIDEHGNLLAPKLPKRPTRVGAVPSKATGTTILVITGIVFIIPLLAMVLFSLRVVGSKTAFTFDHYTAIFQPANELTYDGLFQGLVNSLGICAITVGIVLVLLLPTMLLVELRYPQLRRLLEFVCIIPITIPSIVLVVGFVPVYQVVSQIFGSYPWTLAFAIGVIVLPYAFRPIAANLAGVEVGILSEAGRSLGANWAQVLWRVILPNLRRGILSACFITIAVVLGEFTIASFASQNTFQTALLLLQQTDPYVGVIFALAALVFTFVILLIIGRFARDRKAS
ncbi:MAG: ABC-type spermidine/putrescine transport system, permease component [Microbacteriaceae bacterium]|jgi:putative spermidine/putrescine transport system permease protein|nr:ABC-type spermidine/putrescine transport system, permease component [Microbacteriaceae bacterium]